jgi:hypothetical protein
MYTKIIILFLCLLYLKTIAQSENNAIVINVETKSWIGYQIDSMVKQYSNDSLGRLYLSHFEGMISKTNLQSDLSNIYVDYSVDSSFCHYEKEETSSELIFHYLLKNTFKLIIPKQNKFCFIESFKGTVLTDIDTSIITETYILHINNKRIALYKSKRQESSFTFDHEMSYYFTKEYGLILAYSDSWNNYYRISLVKKEDNIYVDLITEYVLKELLKKW